MHAINPIQDGHKRPNSDVDVDVDAGVSRIQGGCHVIYIYFGSS